MHLFVTIIVFGSRLQPRTEAMLQAVASRKVLSKPELFVQWAKDEKCMYIRGRGEGGGKR